MHGKLVRERNPPKIDGCDCCSTTSAELNLFRGPFSYRHCVFCSILYEKNCDKGLTLCENCAYNICLGFCKDREKKMGKWTPYWREVVYKYIDEYIS